jgi:ABC-type antimicrobial peptide transport system ATPase subunit
MIATIGYGTYYDQVTIDMTLVTVKKPTIKVDSMLINAPTNEVNFTISNETKTIQDTTPSILKIFISITNNGTTPVNTLTINETLPNDWNWTQQLSIAMIKGNNTIYISETHYTTKYDAETQNLLITIPDIKTAIGEKQNQNDTLAVVFNVKNKLIGEPLPPEYENNPPSYLNTATITAMTGTEGWKSDPSCTTLPFTTHIYSL